MDDAIPSAFTHLRVHSHYSLLAGAAPVAQLAARAAADGLPALALTDKHALYGAVAFRRACQKVGIRPLLGMVVHTAPPVADALADPIPGQLLLLARGPAGYRSLAALSSAVLCAPDGQYRRGVPWQLVQTHAADVIAIDGGQMGWLARYVQAGNRAAATQYASRLGGTFEERGFVGIEWHRPADTALIHEVTEVSGRFGIRAAVAQPVYCLEAADTPKLRLLAAIDQNCPLELAPSETLPGGGAADATLHWLSPAEIGERFAPFPEAITAVSDIVQQCIPPLPDGRPIWPAIDLPDGQTADEALRSQAADGLAQRCADLEEGTAVATAVTAAIAVYESRLQRELEAIIQQGFAPLFLLVADITRFARQTGVPVNTRGSVANSLVAYSLGITNIDPIQHDLLFERFLNPARANLPDIDLDFCSRRRDEVLHYLRDKYGADRMALVATISTLQPKSAVRETAKAYGLPEAAIKRLTGLLPRHWHPDPRRREGHTLDDILAQIEDEREREVVTAAWGIIGQPHHLSIHPGGVVLTPGPLTDVTPVQMAPKGFLITQFDFRDVEAIGLPKIDLLGIRALTVLADTAVLVQARRDPHFDLTTIPAADADTGRMIAAGDTIGVFQCESTGAQRTLRQLHAQTVADLAVANAFFKPGPATGGMAAAFIRRYRGEEPVSYLHPALEPILASTQGVLLFQEQVLRVATEIAGMSWREADHLRRGMSKFKQREMAAMRLRFVTGCRQRSEFAAAQAETLWEQVLAFAGYGFNQGHATAYADVSYRSAYLKAHYPAEFLCARLQDHGGFHHPAIYIAEARRLGIPVHPPHVNVSDRKFTLADDDENGAALYMGLGQVRDLRRASVRAIVRERPFAHLRDLLSRVPLRDKEVRHLIQCGALDGLGESRAALLAQAQQAARAGSARQMAFGFAQETAVAPESLADRLAWERKLLGWPVSANPLALAAAETAADTPLAQVHRLRNQKTAVVGCRLPGWTGGRGVYFGDGQHYIEVRLEKNVRSKLRAWQPMRLSGQWRADQWGGGWFAVTAVERLVG